MVKYFRFAKTAHTEIAKSGVFQASPKVWLAFHWDGRAPLHHEYDQGRGMVVGQKYVDTSGVKTVVRDLIGELNDILRELGDS